jgi:hypothetical protein
MRDIARDQLLAELLALRPEFERRGVLRMALFGSRARGDNRSDSDVDVVIEPDPNRQFSGLNAAGVLGIIEDRIGLDSSVVVLDRFTPAEFIAAVERDRLSVF